MLLDQALEWIAQNRTGMVILVSVMMITLWLRRRR
ncbi:hypothetical protein C8P66_108158 [Humitalea rosea]|uniref:Uncharacterized protein n=1 Tax=Humitalea rosea TaxID=990373 RepID=A0A2W7IJQ8_9PROT|nr:hypothetical protein C8P66_108158 [Humitalea rosea]